MSQSKTFSTILLTLGLALLLPVSAAAAGKTTASGTLTVNGKPTVLKFGWASLGPDTSSPDREVLVLLFADRDLPAADRTPARLAELSAAGKLSALRILWSTGFDFVAAVPYQAGLEGSGKRAQEAPTLNLDAFDEVNVKADVVSKRLGQKVHFSTKIEGPIEKVAAVELELPVAVEEDPAESAGAAPAGNDPKSLKLRLGKLGYPFEPERFAAAVGDGNLEAVQLFLQLGQSPNYVDQAGNHQLLLATQFCANEPVADRGAIVRALLAAKAEVDTKDQNNSTPLLWAAQSCDGETVKALLAAGAKVNNKSKGGATPLMMAKVLNRPEIVAILQKAGGKEN